jgi:hypothetical protein
MKELVSAHWIFVFVTLSLIIEFVENYLLGFSVFPISTFPILFLAYFMKYEYLMGAVLLWLAIALIKELFVNKEITPLWKVYNIFLK